LFASAPLASAQSLVGRIDVNIVAPNADANVVVNPQTRQLFVTGQATGAPTGAIAVVDLETNRSTLTEIPDVFFWQNEACNCWNRQYAAINTATNRVYVVGQRFGDQGILVFDGATRAAQFFPSVFNFAGGIAVDSTRNRIYATGRDDYSDRILVLDGDTMTTLAVYQMPTVASPVVGAASCTFASSGGIAIDQRRNQVFLSGGACGNTLGILDVGSGHVDVLPRLARPELSAEYFEVDWQLAVDEEAGRVLMRGLANGYVGVFDEATRTLSLVLTPYDRAEGGIAVNSATHRGFVAAPDRLVAIDPIGGAVWTTPAGAFQPGTTMHPAIDPTTNRLYAISQFDGVLVVDLGLSEVATGSGVSVQADVASITFESVATAGSITVVPIADAGTAGEIPGGFAISDVMAFEVMPSPSLTFSGSATTCVKVAGIDDATTFGQLQMLHMEGGVLVNRTSSRDFASRTLCATTTSFSPFYVALAGLHAKPLFDQTKAYRAGSTMPIRLQLLDPTGVNVSMASLPLTVRKLTALRSGSTLPVTDAGNANPDATFRYDAALGGYILNLSTKGLAAGRYALSFWAGSARTFFYTIAFEVR
jgi:DNA-binding beta-propeller fold protein YncE